MNIEKQYANYKKDRVAGKCYVKYYEYGFVDYLFDPCECKDCTRYSDAQDVVENKASDISAVVAMREHGFTGDEIIIYLAIFDDLGIFTENEIAGIQELKSNGR